MSLFLSHIHEEIRRARLTKRGATHHPADVPQGVHKTYPRMQRLTLPPLTPLEASLADVLLMRRSRRAPTNGIQLSASEWSTVLGHALGTHAHPQSRQYPSGGRLFPIETYVIATGIESFGPGVFHYNPTEHCLEWLWALPAGFDIKQLAKKPDDNLFTALIVFTSVWERSSMKYGDLAYSHALLEAGHMSENVLLVSTALKLSTCPMAGFNDERIIELLDLNEELEQPVHAITVSKQTQGVDSPPHIVE